MRLWQTGFARFVPLSKSLCDIVLASPWCFASSRRTLCFRPIQATNAEWRLRLFDNQPSRIVEAMQPLQPPASSSVYGRHRAIAIGDDSVPAADAPPQEFDTTTVLDALLNPKSDHRESAALHQQCDWVVLDSVDLGSQKSWPVVLDEALRLLAPSGSLTLRAQDSALLSIFALKHQLLHWGGITLTEEARDPRGGLRLQLVNNRLARRPMGVDGITFGVITNSTSLNAVAPFIDSVLSLDGLEAANRQIVVCGPRALGDVLAREQPGITFVDQPREFADRGWITRKKNLIVDAARHESLVICHDRYEVPRNFVHAMRAFGGDFDVIVPRQVCPDGARFPDWVTLGSTWDWGVPAMLHYDDWTPYGYVNGGAMIAKTARLREVPWNDLLFWNQAEDVELSRRLQARGVVPRLARDVVLRSRTLRPPQTQSFDSMPLTQERYMLPASQTAHQFAPRLPYDVSVPLGSHFSDFAARFGVAFDSAWEQETDAIMLRSPAIGEVTVRLPYSDESLAMILSVDSGEGTLQCELNGVDVTASRSSESESTFTIVLPQTAELSVRRLKMRSDHDVRLRAICVRPRNRADGALMPTDERGLREAADRAALRAALHLQTANPRTALSTAGNDFDGTGVCIADLPLLLRGARSVVVVIPGDFASLHETTSLLAALRSHVRADASIHVAADPALTPLLHGWNVLPIVWTRFLSESAYADERAAAAQGLAPDLLIHAAPTRTLASELLMLQLSARAVVGFEQRDSSITSEIEQYARPRYTRLLTCAASRPEQVLARALALPDADRMVWPEPRSALLGNKAAESHQRDGSHVLALLGDSSAALESPHCVARLHALRAAGWKVVGLGAAQSVGALRAALTNVPGASNLAGRLDLAGQHGFLSRADAYLAGGPGLRALASMAGCTYAAD